MEKPTNLDAAEKLVMLYRAITIDRINQLVSEF